MACILGGENRGLPVRVSDKEKQHPLESDPVKTFWEVCRGVGNLLQVLPPNFSEVALVRTCPNTTDFGALCRSLLQNSQNFSEVAPKPSGSNPPSGTAWGPTPQVWAANSPTYMTQKQAFCQWGILTCLCWCLQRLCIAVCPWIHHMQGIYIAEGFQTVLNRWGGAWCRWAAKLSSAHDRDRNRSILKPARWMGHRRTTACRRRRARPTRTLEDGKGWGHKRGDLKMPFST